MMANTAGTLPMGWVRAGIGKGRVVMAMMIAVESVPRFCRKGLGQDIGVYLFNF